MTHESLDKANTLKQKIRNITIFLKEAESLKKEEYKEGFRMLNAVACFRDPSFTDHFADLVRNGIDQMIQEYKNQIIQLEEEFAKL